MEDHGRIRTILGFIVAPVTPGILMALRTDFSNEPWAAIWIIQLSAVLGYPVALILGVPLYMYFRRRRWHQPHLYVAVGIVLGFAAVLGVFFMGSIGPAITGGYWPIDPLPLKELLLGGIFGGIACFFFWLIAIWRRDDI